MRIIFIFLLLGLSASLFAQNTWTVDNSPGSAAKFSSLQTAIDSAADGDVLLIHGSGISYGSVTMNKRLMLIGPGYLLDQNEKPNTQVNTSSALVADMIISGPATAGSVITGMQFRGGGSAGGHSINLGNTSNIIISRCYITHSAGNRNAIVANTVNNLRVEQSFIEATPGNSYVTALNTASVTFENCFILTNVYLTDLSNNSTINFNHCSQRNLGGNATLYTWSGAGSASFTANNSIFEGIFATSGPSAMNFSRCISTSALPNVNGNIDSVNINSVFLTPLTPGLPREQYFELAAGSPAIGAGTGGTDIGATGGASPYKKAGIPFVPNIYTLDVPRVGTTNGGLKIRVQARANQ